MPFLDADDRKLIVDEVEDELLTLEGDMLDDVEIDSETVVDITERTSEETSEPPAKKKEGPIQTLIGELFQQTSQSPHPLSPHSSKVARELELYKAEKPSTLTQIP